MKPVHRLGIALSLAVGLIAPAAAAGLEPGMKAPGLKFSEWVKGKEVKAFQPGHVYVVEFWATWCGPCIEGMPHLSELQKKYQGKVTVIGVNSFERGEGIPEKVKAFVKEQGEKMSYTVARDTTDNFMATNWMTAASQNGIPTAFIIDQKGTLAWVGHPMMMDEPLAQVVDGTFDIEASKKQFAEQAAANEKRMANAKRVAAIEKKYRDGSKEEALKEFDKLVAEDPNQKTAVDLAKLNLFMNGDFPKAEAVIRGHMKADADSKMPNMVLLNFVMNDLKLASNQEAYNKLKEEVIAHILSHAPENDYFVYLNMSSAYFNLKNYDKAMDLVKQGLDKFEADPQKREEFRKYFQDQIKRIQDAQKGSG